METAPEPAALRAPGRERLALTVLYGAAVLAYAILGHRLPVPMVSPDEYTYGQLGQSLAHGDGLAWRGEPVALRAPLYVLAIAPAWIVSGGTVGGYALAKLLGAAMLCTVALPAWWLARRIAGATAGLLAAALTLAGPALILGGEVMTENLAYPLAAGSLAALVVALREPGSRAGWVAFALAAAAAGARIQLAVLVPVIAAAVLADAARRPATARSQALHAQRALLGASAGLSVAGGAFALLAGGTALGSYEGVGGGASATDAIAAVGHQLVGLVASSGVLPVIAALAVSVRRDAWRDPWIGPLLAVVWPATALLVLESAVAIAGYDNAWHIERYVVYVLPLLNVLVVAALTRGLIGLRAALGASVVVGAALLAAPGVREAEEELATYAIAHLGDALLGLSAPVSLLLAALLAGGALAAAARRGGDGAAVAGGALLLALVVLAVPAWTWKTDIARGWRAAFPADLAWTDHRAGPPLARIVGASNASVFEVGEFFNRSISGTYVPQTPIGGRIARGPSCTWRAAADGTLSVTRGCGAAPRRFYLDDYYAKLTFHDQRVLLDRPPVARIVEVPGRARLRAEFFPACGPPLPALAADGSSPAVGPRRRSCPVAQIGANLWLDRPARLVLRWRGGINDEQAVAGGRTYVIKAGGTTTIRLPAPAGAASFAMQLGWRGSPPLAPALVSATLVDRDGSIDLLY